MTTAKDETFICPECELPFKNEEAVQKHRENWHGVGGMAQRTIKKKEVSNQNQEGKGRSAYKVIISSFIIILICIGATAAFLAWRQNNIKNRISFEATSTAQRMVEKNTCQIEPESARPLASGKSANGAIWVVETDSDGEITTSFSAVPDEASKGFATSVSDAQMILCIYTEIESAGGCSYQGIPGKISRTTSHKTALLMDTKNGGLIAKKFFEGEPPSGCPYRLGEGKSELNKEPVDNDVIVQWAMKYWLPYQ